MAVYRVWLLAILLLLSACGLDDTPNSSIEHASQGVYDAKLSLKGEYAVVASINHGGSFWRLSDGERLYNWNHAAGSYTNLVAVALSGNGKIALTADQRRLVAWRASDGKSIGFWNTPAKVLCIALSYNGRYALVGLDNYTAIYIDIQDGTLLNTVTHEGAVKSVALSANGGLGITGSEDLTARLWRLKDGKQLRKWDHNFTVNYVTLSGDGTLAFTSSQHDRSFIWDAKKNQVAFEIASRSATVTAARFSINNEQLLIGTTARKVALWDLKNKTKVTEWITPKKSNWKPEGVRIYDVSFSSKPDTFYSIASNGMSYQWSLKD